MIKLIVILFCFGISPVFADEASTLDMAGEVSMAMTNDILTLQDNAAAAMERFATWVESKIEYYANEASTIIVDYAMSSTDAKVASMISGESTGGSVNYSISSGVQSESNGGGLSVSPGSGLSLSGSSMSGKGLSVSSASFYSTSVVHGGKGFGLGGGGFGGAPEFHIIHLVMLVTILSTILLSIRYRSMMIQ